MEEEEAAMQRTWGAGGSHADGEDQHWAGGLDDYNYVAKVQ